MVVFYLLYIIKKKRLYWFGGYIPHTPVLRVLPRGYIHLIHILILGITWSIRLWARFARPIRAPHIKRGIRSQWGYMDVSPSTTRSQGAMGDVSPSTTRSQGAMGDVSPSTTRS
jgi:hypothetical protein